MKIFLFLVFQISMLFSIQGQSSYPHLSGYTWAFFCDWRWLNSDYGSGPEIFAAEEVKLGDTIFVDYTCLDLFAQEILPRIQDPVILITANYGYGADLPMPGPYGSLLDSPKIAAWFVQNLDREPSEKLIPIPMGIASRHWPHGNTDLLDFWMAQESERTILTYLNLTPRPERMDCIKHFSEIGFKFEGSKSFDAYLSDLLRTKFVISPRGNALDCHRTWEALLMGCYPVVKSSTLDPIFDDLPVVIVEDWSEVTEVFLEEKYREFNAKSWNRDKLFAPFWFQRVKEIQFKLRHPFAESIQKTDFLNGFPACCYLCEAEKNELGKICKKLYESYQEKFAISDEYLIPKLIHFIWLGSPLPECSAILIETWRKFHPTWTIKVWTDSDIPEFQLQNKIAFDKARNYGEKSDIFRYEILYRYGGVYFDTDFECLKPFDDLHKSSEFYTGTIGGTAEYHCLLNGLIGSRPGHPILKACIENIRVGNGDHDSARIFNDTGPHYFAQILQKTISSEDFGNVVVLPPLFFYPFNPPAQTTTDREELKKCFVHPETMAIHYWHSSWQVK